MADRSRFKFEGFKVGDRIKAYDFKPFVGENGVAHDYYVIGTIVGVGLMFQGALCYRIDVTEDTACPTSRETVYVPYEVMLLEWDGRVTLVEEGKQ